MQPLETLTLKAFVFALYYLDAPLPDELQKQVKQLTIPDDIGQLNKIARKHPPLDQHYQAVRQNLTQKTQIRSKGPLPDEINQATEQQSTEINNNLVVIDKHMNDEELTKIATQALKSNDSVSQFKISIHSFLQRLKP